MWKRGTEQKGLGTLDFLYSSLISNSRVSRIM